MMTGFFSGAASMDALERRQDIIAANLANVSTPGYRRRVETLETMGSNNANSVPGNGSLPRFSLAVDFTPGDITNTGSKMDIALIDPVGSKGTTFIAVTAPDGRTLYTRNGRFAMDSQGKLIHASSGFPVAGTNDAEIRLTAGFGEPMIDDRGMISQGEASLGQLKISGFTNPGDLFPTEHGLFAPGPTAGEKSAVGIAQVKQGYIESSNANPVNELVDMISNYRAYEASQKVLKQIDKSMQNLIRNAVR